MSLYAYSKQQHRTRQNEKCWLNKTSGEKLTLTLMTVSMTPMNIYHHHGKQLSRTMTCPIPPRKQGNNHAN